MEMSGRQVGLADSQCGYACGIHGRQQNERYLQGDARSWQAVLDSRSYR